MAWQADIVVPPSDPLLIFHSKGRKGEEAVPWMATQ